MVNRPTQTSPFHIVAVDMFECEGNNYLYLQDYLSRYIKVERRYSSRASFIIMKIKCILSRHGIPEQVFSDSGPQFSCSEFAEFDNTWGFVTRHPVPISTVERVVREGYADCEVTHNEGNGIGSRSLHRSTGYRTTPISGCLKSPAQLLMSRRLRSIIPGTPASLQPVLVNPYVTQRRFKEKQEQHNMFYDRKPKLLR